MSYDHAFMFILRLKKEAFCFEIFLRNEIFMKMMTIWYIHWYKKVNWLFLMKFISNISSVSYIPVFMSISRLKIIKFCFKIFWKNQIFLELMIIWCIHWNQNLYWLFFYKIHIKKSPRWATVQIWSWFWVWKITKYMCLNSYWNFSKMNYIWY